MSSCLQTLKQTGAFMECVLVKFQMSLSRIYILRVCYGSGTRRGKCLEEDDVEENMNTD